MAEIRILPAKPEYVEECARISAEVYGRIHEGYEARMGEELHGRYYAGWREAKMDSIRRDMERGIPAGRAFMAFDGDEVVGFVTYSVDAGGNGVIGNNAVKNSCRGHGIGPKLYAKCFEAMRAEGIEYASVVTGGDDGHAPARRAYEKAGFRAFLPSVRYFRKL